MDTTDPDRSAKADANANAEADAEVIVNAGADAGAEVDIIKASVVAWHNRSLLTCRINATRVTGIGVVALPFAQTVAATAELSIDAIAESGGRFARIRRWLRTRRRFRAAPLFNDDFLPPLGLPAIGRFASRHGDSLRPGEAAWPLRVIPPTDSAAPRASRYLRTAAIESGGRRLRVLIGSGPDPQILGPRLWNRNRLSALVGCLSLLASVGSAGSLLWPARAPASDSPQLATARLAGEPTPAALAREQVIDSPMNVIAAASSAARADSPSPSPSPSPVAVGESRPADRDSTSVAPPATVAVIASAPSDGAVFALAADPTRSRMSSAIRMSLLEFPGEPRPGGAHAELMQAGTQWRVVIWPYASRELAEQAQAMMRKRGVKLELIAF